MVLVIYIPVFLQDCYSPGLFPNLDLQLSTGNGITEEASLRHPFSKEKMWLVGLQVSFLAVHVMKILCEFPHFTLITFSVSSKSKGDHESGSWDSARTKCSMEKNWAL